MDLVLQYKKKYRGDILVITGNYAGYLHIQSKYGNLPNIAEPILSIHITSKDPVNVVTDRIKSIFGNYELKWEINAEDYISISDIDGIDVLSLAYLCARINEVDDPIILHQLKKYKNKRC